MVYLTLCRHFRRALPASRLFLAGVLTAALGLFSASSAQAQQVEPSQPGHRSQPSKPVRPIHIVPFITPPQGPHVPQVGTHLSYYGGPVISNVQVIVVYWGANVNSEIIAKIPSFYEGVTDSAYFDMLSEYSTDVTPVGGGSGTNQSIGRGSFVQATTITPAIGDCPPTCNLSDSEIQTELIGQINAGHLPGPEYDNAGNDNTEYAIYFPPGANITDPAGNGSCVSGGFCAYHGTATYNSKYLAYGIFPDFFSPSSGCSSGCGSSPDEFQNLTSVSSHEMAEAVTDIAVGDAGSLAPPLAWYDTRNGEIGDICNAQQSSVSTPVGTYTVQKLWSNALGACVTSGLDPSYQLTAPSTANSGTSFSLTLTAQNPAGGKGTDIAYAGTVHFTSSDNAGGVVLPSDFTFTSSNQGTASFSATLQSTGTQTITATDTVNSAITATASINVSTNPTPTTTTMVSSPNPSTFGQSVTFTATVTPTAGGTPTGTVTFTADGSNVLGAISLSGGQAALMASSLAVGSHSIVARYSGDSAHLASASTAWTQTVKVASTTTGVTSSLNPAAIGQTVTYTATVTSQYMGITSGSVTFKSGSTALGSATLVNGQASISTSFSTSGTRSITAAYVGDVNNTGSKSLALQQLVNKSPSSTAVASDINPSDYGQLVTFTATVTCSISPTKTVTFKYGGAVLGKVPLAGGTATLSSSALGAGTDAVTAIYSGDGNCASSTSPVLEQVVNIAATTESLTSSQNPSSVGQSVTFTATVSSSAGVPTGKVKFLRGATALGTVTLSGGVATLTTTKLPAGSDPITANYLGTANYGTSSASLTQVVQ
jgi:hypothetical protein